MRVLLFGGTGRLGAHVARTLPVVLPAAECISPTHAECDVREPREVEILLRDLSPEVVINCAAITDVDAAERDPRVAWQVNCDAARVMAEGVAARAGSFMVHVSTDYVFGAGTGAPYSEWDSPDPVNEYGRTKAAAEDAISTLLPGRHLIARTAWLYGGARDDYASSILHALERGERVAVADDVRSNPTYAPDAAERILRLFREATRDPALAGIHHVVNQGSASRLEVGQHLREIAGAPGRLEAVSVTSFHLSASRPANSALVDTRSPSAGLPAMRGWREAMTDFVRTRRAGT